ncbi:MAG: lytic transglycosylase domain-containing protein [Flavobacteriaceae bacterium]|jgi:hypothetical protein|nr:lytic transglycosylase domain-containing protein [Flavobacteriaceae bacterium]
MKKRLSTITTLTFLLAITNNLLASNYTSELPIEKATTVEHIYPLPISINFAGEKVPMHLIDVKERLDREMIINTNLHSTTVVTIKRAARYFPVIEPILKKNGIPDDFKYLCVIESTLSNAVSSAGASGFWQFMKGTAKDYKMTVDEYVDERYDVVKATEAACKYFNDAYRKFGNWTLVAASYNRGMGGISRAMDSQLVDNYYDMYLNQETSRYVFRILALKEIMSAPDKYGYAMPIQEMYKPVKTKQIEVSTDIDDLAKFAKEQGINYKLIKLYNPWLMSTSLKVNGKIYQIDIPTEGI